MNIRDADRARWRQPVETASVPAMKIGPLLPTLARLAFGCAALILFGAAVALVGAIIGATS